MASTTGHRYILSYLRIVALVLLVPMSPAAVVIPSSNCYVLDSSNHLIDFTDWIGHPFEYDGKDADMVVRFCKDVETRSQTGYVDFGHYNPFNYFRASSGPVNFIQEFFYGDLSKCESSFDKMGRTAQVNIICGKCLNGACKSELGCICNVTYDSAMCRALVDLAIPCVRQGPRVFPGFTVGFHPRSWEVVYNGMTQLGFDKAHQQFRFLHSFLAPNFSLFQKQLNDGLGGLRTSLMWGTLSYSAGRPPTESLLQSRAFWKNIQGRGG